MSNTMNKLRESNIELCRIICMLLIVAHHSVIHGGAITMEENFNKYIAYIFVPGGKICFVTFMAISTWFLVEKDFKWSRFLKTYTQVLFYSIVFAIIAYCYGVQLAYKDWFSVLLPIAGNSHGFAATYLAFYLILPFLGIISACVNKKQLRVLLIVLFYYEVVSKIIGTVTGYMPPLLSNELMLFVFFYFISLWLKRYPLQILTQKKKLFFLLLFLYLIIYFTYYICDIKQISSRWMSVIKILANDESSVLYILSGYLLFFIFYNAKISYNKYINYIAHASFGVLLFHDHNVFRYIVWDKILYASNYYYSWKFIYWVIVSTLFIYFIGILIDLIRDKITTLAMPECIVEKFSDVMDGYTDFCGIKMSNLKSLRRSGE